MEQPRETHLESEILKLYDLYSSSLLGYATTLIRDGEIARDAVQEAFLRCSLMLHTGRTISSPRAWLFRVLRNYLLDLMKASHTRNEIGMDPVPEVLDDSWNPERQYASTEMSRRLRSALTLREYECLRLRNEGLRYTEIAEVLSIRPGTVATLLSRCSVKAQELMGPANAGGAAELTAAGPYAS